MAEKKQTQVMPGMLRICRKGGRGVLCVQDPGEWSDGSGIAVDSDQCNHQPGE